MSHLHICVPLAFVSWPYGLMNSPTSHVREDYSRQQGLPWQLPLKLCAASLISPRNTFYISWKTSWVAIAIRDSVERAKVRQRFCVRQVWQVMIQLEGFFLLFLFILSSDSLISFFISLSLSLSHSHSILSIWEAWHNLLLKGSCTRTEWEMDKNAFNWNLFFLNCSHFTYCTSFQMILPGG